MIDDLKTSNYNFEEFGKKKSQYVTYAQYNYNGVDKNKLLKQLQMVACNYEPTFFEKLRLFFSLNIDWKYQHSDNYYINKLNQM